MKKKQANENPQLPLLSLTRAWQQVRRLFESRTHQLGRGRENAAFTKFLP
ncbi:MAG: hypothetical protein ACT4O2_03320 [Beijerinckiaceae bacterium]